MQPGDDVRYGLADARDFAQALFVDDLRERLGKSAQALGGARIGSGAIGITATQGDPFPNSRNSLITSGVSIAAMARNKRPCRNGE